MTVIYLKCIFIIGRTENPFVRFKANNTPYRKIKQIKETIKIVFWWFVDVQNTYYYFYLFIIIIFLCIKEKYDV